MTLRWIIGIGGALIMLLGASQIAFPYWWLDTTESLMASTMLRYWGILSVAIGILLVAAYATRQVGLRLFVLILGVYVIVVGVLILAAPSLIRDVIRWLIVDRSQGFQEMVVRAAGLLRVVLGGALLYAAMKVPRPLEAAQ